MCLFRTACQRYSEQIFKGNSGTNTDTINELISEVFDRPNFEDPEDTTDPEDPWMVLIYSVLFVNSIVNFKCSLFQTITISVALFFGGCSWLCQ